MLLSVPSPFPVLPPLVPALALQALPWTLSSPSDSALPSLALRRVPCTLAACPGPWKPPLPQGLPQARVCSPQFSSAPQPFRLGSHCLPRPYPRARACSSRLFRVPSWSPRTPPGPVCSSNPVVEPLGRPPLPSQDPPWASRSFCAFSGPLVSLLAFPGVLAGPPSLPAGSPGLLPALAPSLWCPHFAFTSSPLCSFSCVPAPSRSAPSLIFLCLGVSAPFPSRGSAPSSQSPVDSPKHPGVGAGQASAVGVRRLVFVLLIAVLLPCFFWASSASPHVPFLCPLPPLCPPRPSPGILGERAGAGAFLAFPSPHHPSSSRLPEVSPRAFRGGGLPRAAGEGGGGRGRESGGGLRNERFWPGLAGPELLLGAP